MCLLFFKIIHSIFLFLLFLLWLYMLPNDISPSLLFILPERQCFSKAPLLVSLTPISFPCSWCCELPSSKLYSVFSNLVGLPCSGVEVVGIWFIFLLDDNLKLVVFSDS